MPLPNPPLPHYRDWLTKWFWSKPWSMVVYVLVIGLPALLGWVVMLKTILEWLGIKKSILHETLPLPPPLPQHPFGAVRWHLDGCDGRVGIGAMNPKLMVRQIATGVHVDGGGTVCWGLVYLNGGPPSKKKVETALREAGFDFVHNVLTQVVFVWTAIRTGTKGGANHRQQRSLQRGLQRLLGRRRCRRQSV